MKIDLHTHSQASPDGALTVKDYKRLLDSGTLDCIAVTDHNRIDYAQQLHQEQGEQIIVGEEVTTTEGEIIGLYLTEAVPAGLSAAETVKKIKEQGGLVYIPHPFETVRKGITLATLDSIAGDVDIIEAYNGRTFQNRGGQATEWAKVHNIPGAASSDAHGKIGWGNTYSVITEAPSRDTLVTMLRSATYQTHSVGLIGRLYPKLNRLRSHRNA